MTADRGVDAHDHEQVDSREIAGRDPELAGQLRDGFVRAVGVERRSDRVTLAERLEDPHGLGSPEINGKMRRKLVPEQDRALRGGLLEVIEVLDPPAQKDTSRSDRQEVE